MYLPLGGFTVSSMDEGKVVYFRQDAYEGFKYAVMYPDYTLPTFRQEESCLRRLPSVTVYLMLAKLPCLPLL